MPERVHSAMLRSQPRPHGGATPSTLIFRGFDQDGAVFVKFVFNIGGHFFLLILLLESNWSHSPLTSYPMRGHAQNGGILRICFAKGLVLPPFWGELEGGGVTIYLATPIVSRCLIRQANQFLHPNPGDHNKRLTLDLLTHDPGALLYMARH